ncbi:alanine--tRNA ligase [Fluviispira multicolorata]|uniref:Alanine--tRNA ligase n=1 Tax=Fluviispira multicolorata TaxID=2654512 RepID=A0A833N675_9BACT|nr:alanine--tRNA ligase [Fluviispira multicolorata]KAB8032214.1 alanine--tRNA ligase [Fluviispira multicolorata]
MKTNEIRRKFIHFFETKKHTYVPSASTIPIADQTILFTIAGMTQFKACLTGEEVRSYKRATNSQKCIRVGDLDDVGKDGRHCTMFEMLGSWSFGDYYKKEAIKWAYEFTRDELKLDLSRFWATVHHTDEEALEIWKSIGVPEERIVRLGDKDNFWAMGPTGPCGPCSELYLDQGEKVGQCYEKGLICKGPGCDCDRYLEYWNLVFMQYNRQEDGTLLDLPMKSVDTGMGLERVAALSQGKTALFEIDLFEKIKEEILLTAKINAKINDLSEQQKESCNVVADHIRLLTFTIADGANFSNEGRGYVLRRVLRRAVRHAHRLSPNWPKDQSFLEKIVKTVVTEMGEFYPEIVKNKTRIEEAIRNEELRFSSTLESGLAKFNHFVEEAKSKNLKTISGENIFILHDSFGFPSDLTRVLCEEIGFKADLENFDKHMLEQKERSRAEAKFYKFDQDDSPWFELNKLNQNDDKNFAGYNLKVTTKSKENIEYSEVQIPNSNIKRVRQLKNKLFEIIIANTAFYPEGGGQISDIGYIVALSKEIKNEFEVLDVRKTVSSIIHLLKHTEYSSESADYLKHDQIKNLFANQNKVTALVDFSARQSTMRNHTATHLAHRALQLVVGENVRQAGSLVNSHALRFDFSHNKAMTAKEIEQVELLVNSEILKNIPVKTLENVPLAKAKEMGAMAMFDEKYDDHVRMLEIAGFSLELCAGTHVSSTGQIGLFKIISEGSVTSGVRRIEAVTGFSALDYIKKIKNTLAHTAEVAKCSETEISQRILAMRENAKDLEKNIAQLQSRLVNAQISELMLNSIQLKNNIRLVVTLIETSDVKEMELMCDRLKEKSDMIAVIAAILDNRVLIMSAINPTLVKQNKKLSAGNIVKQLSEMLGGKGGGRPDFARGGGINTEQLPSAIKKVEEIVIQMIS